MALKRQSSGPVRFEVTGDFPELPALFQDERQGEMKDWWDRVRITISEREEQLVERIRKLEEAE